MRRELYHSPTRPSTGAPGAGAASTIPPTGSTAGPGVDGMRATSGRQVRLTSLASCAGCASKLNAESLAQVLRPLQSLFESAESPDLLVGLGAPGDAAVWRLGGSRALRGG